MPGGHERFKNTTGCHTSALGELFISRPAQKCKGEFEECVNPPIWCPSLPVGSVPWSAADSGFEFEVEIDLNRASSCSQMEYPRLFVFDGTDPG
jgi:hypothetical protein